MFKMCGKLHVCLFLLELWGLIECCPYYRELAGKYVKLRELLACFKFHSTLRREAGKARNMEEKRIGKVDIRMGIWTTFYQRWQEIFFSVHSCVHAE